MNDAALFDATVPVFRHYLRRIEAMLDAVPDGQEALLRRRLAPGAFCAAEHLSTAIGFSLRTACPLAGREVPDIGDGVVDKAGLVRLGREVRDRLDGIEVATFAGASDRTVRHAAGEAELEQDATTFVTLFALPNFFFHIGMAFAILRRGGLTIGKADFDGQHVYPAGFRF